MGRVSAIEWTHSTFNIWWGCTKISPGCQNCYAERLANRYGTGWGPEPRRFLSEKYWLEPHKWERKAAKAGVRHRVFCSSMADVFEITPGLDGHRMNSGREALWQLIEDTPHLDWLLLTKRPQNVQELTPMRWWKGWPPNAWLGVSVEDQPNASIRLPILADLQKVHGIRRSFVSAEPLLGEIETLRTHGGWLPDWVICGGESGPDARPMDPRWPRGLRDYCQANGVKFFFKQWGEWSPEKPPGFARLTDKTWTHQTAAWAKDGTRYNPVMPAPEHFPEVTAYRIGKRAAGRILDGRTWDEIPA